MIKKLTFIHTRAIRYVMCIVKQLDKALHDFVDELMILFNSFYTYIYTRLQLHILKTIVVSTGPFDDHCCKHC